MDGAVLQTIWARTIVRALGDAGVVAVVLSPGSRSTPLAAALVDCALPLHVVIDERSAGFFALGLARAARAPVALVCTSGTAPAHYYPAVIEAAMAEVPLVVVSADRPPEMHGGGAAQTIDQTRLFGAHARTFVDLGPPAADGGELSLRAARRRVIQAVLASRTPRPGPVQIDVPLRKPLEPAAPATDAERALAARADALSTRVAVPHLPRAADDAVAALAAALAASRRPFVVAGPRGLDGALAAAVSRLGRRRGAVVLAEHTSQIRGALDREVARLDRFDLVLPARDFAPDLILQLGAEPVAAAWPGFLAAHADVPRWVVAEHPWPDPHSSAAGVVLGDVADTLARVTAAVPAHADAAWLAEVRAAEAEAARAVDALCDGEPAMLRAALDGAGDALVVLGNSLPVRVADHVSSAPRRVLSQRGACGIDGLIAGAAGAAASGEPVVLILGDVSFAHDIGALALLRGAAAPVTVVVLDNRGGRIFEALPVAGAVAADAFTRLWLTPTDLDVVAIARGFGVAAETVRTPDELRGAVAARKTCVLHVPVPPHSARHLRESAIARLRGVT